MKNIILLCIVFCLLFSCAKDSDSTLKGNIYDYFTGEPLANVHMSFHVVSGWGGLFTNVERNKYSAVSNSKGEFILQDVGDDGNSAFYPEFIRNDFDSTKVEWQYFVDGSHEDSLRIAKGYNTILRMKPAALTYFHHPRLKNPTYPIDTIVISVYNQTKLITLDHPTSEFFYLLPSSMHEIQLTYINNGKKTVKSIHEYISIAFKRENSGVRRFDFNIYLPE